MAGQDIIEVIPRKYRPLLEQSLRGRWQALQEVRFRIGQAVEWYDGKKHRIDATRVTRMDMKEMMDYMSGYSLYAFEDEIAKGYLTIPGGHRVGVAGQVVVEEGKVKYIQNISFANIRISHEKIGCADKILPYLWKDVYKRQQIHSPERLSLTQSVIHFMDHVWKRLLKLLRVAELQRKRPMWRKVFSHMATKCLV